MKNRLIKQIQDNYFKYKSEIVEYLKIYDYRKKRYKVDYTIALYISVEELDADFVKRYVRDTDTVIVLENNFIAVIFDFASVEAGFKAAENLLAYMEPKLSTDEIYVSVVNSHDRLDEREHVRKALDLLIESIDNGYRDIPELPDS